jgi:prepilin-type N-terminal cleavage/methylation domain-containing protein
VSKPAPAPRSSSRPAGRGGSLRRPGFTLLEMVLVMAALSAFLALIGATLVGTIRLQHVGGEVFLSLRAQNMLAEQFRADVARAAEAPPAFERWTARANCLILRLNNGNHIIYHWDQERLERTERNGPDTLRQTLPTGNPRVTAEFSRAGPGQRLVTLRLVEARKQGDKRVLDISAALGGDLR